MEEIVNATSENINVCVHVPGYFKQLDDLSQVMISDLSGYYQHMGSRLAQNSPHCQGLKVKLIAQ